MGHGPRRKFTQKELILLEGWSMLRHPMHIMAGLLGMSEAYLEKMVAKDNAARNAIDAGRVKGRETAVKELFAQATRGREVVETSEEIINTGKFDSKGQPILHKRVKKVTKQIPPDPTQLRFWLQTQEDFKITDKVEHTGKDGKPIRYSNVQEPQTEEEILAEIALIEARRAALKDA